MRRLSGVRHGPAHAAAPSQLPACLRVQTVRMSMDINYNHLLRSLPVHDYSCQMCSLQAHTDGENEHGYLPKLPATQPAHLDV
eukprot:1148682-Pelagomonas_calceolata.AAC.11